MEFPGPQSVKAEEIQTTQEEPAAASGECSSAKEEIAFAAGLPAGEILPEAPMKSAPPDEQIHVVPPDVDFEQLVAAAMLLSTVPPPPADEDGQEPVMGEPEDEATVGLSAEEVAKIADLLAVDGRVLQRIVNFLGPHLVPADILQQAQNYHEPPGPCRTPIYDLIVRRVNLQLGAEGRLRLKSAISTAVAGNRAMQQLFAREIAPLKSATVQQLLQIAEASGCLDAAITLAKFPTAQSENAAMRRLASAPSAAVRHSDRSARAPSFANSRRRRKRHRSPFVGVPPPAKRRECATPPSHQWWSYGTGDESLSSVNDDDAIGLDDCIGDSQAEIDEAWQGPRFRRGLSSTTASSTASSLELTADGTGLRRSQRCLMSRHRPPPAAYSSCLEPPRQRGDSGGMAVAARDSSGDDDWRHRSEGEAKPETLPQLVMNRSHHRRGGHHNHQQHHHHNHHSRHNSSRTKKERHHINTQVGETYGNFVLRTSLVRGFGFDAIGPFLL